MQVVNQTSFHIAGFWHHVTRIHGNVYKDQHNQIFIVKNNRFVSECGFMQSEPIEVKQKGWISADDLFIKQRESYHEFFNTRYFKSL